MQLTSVKGLPIISFSDKLGSMRNNFQNAEVIFQCNPGKTYLGNGDLRFSPTTVYCLSQLLPSSIYSTGDWIAWIYKSSLRS